MLVDDHPMTLAGVAQLIDKQPDLQVIAELGTPAEALTCMEKQIPELIITDLTMPGGGGLELIKNIHALHPEMCVLVLSMHDEQLYAERALHAGAHGYIMKEAGPEALLQAIRHVLGGAIYVSAQLSENILRGFSTHKRILSPMSTLSDRELEVFELIGHGKRTVDIAEQLHLSPKTVEAYRAKIREKLGCEDAHLLLRRAVCWVEQFSALRPRSPQDTEA